MRKRPLRLLELGVSLPFAVNSGANKIWAIVEEKVTYKNSIEEMYFENSTSITDGLFTGIILNYFLTRGNEIFYDKTRRFSDKNLLKKIANKTNENHDLINLASLLGSIIIVAANELGDYVGTGDPKDIPFGMAGCLTYFLARRYAVHRHNRSK